VVRKKKEGSSLREKGHKKKETSISAASHVSLPEGMSHPGRILREVKTKKKSRRSEDQGGGGERRSSSLGGTRGKSSSPSLKKKTLGESEGSWFQGRAIPVHKGKDVSKK